MKIGFLTSKFSPIIGGAETYVYQIALKLHKVGHEVTVITNTHPFRDLSKFPFKIIEINGFDESDPHLFLCLRSLYKVLTTINLDIIHIQNYVPYFLFQQAVPQHVQFKVVLSIHNTPRLGQRLFGWLNNYELEYLFARRALNSGELSLVIHNSRYFASTFEIICEKHYPSVIIPHGIDTQLFSPYGESFVPFEEPPDPKCKLILCTSRLVVRKGIKHLIEALLYLPSEYKLFLTTGSQVETGSIRDELMQLISTLQLDQRVIIPKVAIEYSLLPSLYRGSDVFVMPSEFEGFGISLLEAMSCNLPVIASNVDGIKEIVKSEENGLLVPYGDSIAIAQAILRLDSDQNLRKSLTQRALTFIHESFNLNRGIEDLLQEYRKLLLL